VLERLLALARVPIRVTVDESRLRPADIPALCGDASRLRAAVGWEPVRALDETLLDTLEWFRAQPSPA
jgi:GDP-4-dehydro-6-deoxy-D-mannose reductase